MKNKTTIWIIVALIILFLIWRPKKASAQFAYVAWTDDGRPFPVVAPPDPVMMDIPRDLPFNAWPGPTYYGPSWGNDPIVNTTDLTSGGGNAIRFRPKLIGLLTQ